MANSILLAFFSLAMVSIALIPIALIVMSKSKQRQALQPVRVNAKTEHKKS